MDLKICSNCKTRQTTKSAKCIGRLDGWLWFNCQSCHSTFVFGKGPQMPKSKSPNCAMAALAILAMFVMGCNQTGSDQAATQTPSGTPAAVTQPAVVAPADPAPVVPTQRLPDAMTGSWTTKYAAQVQRPVDESPWCTRDENGWSCVWSATVPDACAPVVQTYVGVDLAVDAQNSTVILAASALYQFTYDGTSVTVPQAGLTLGLDLIDTNLAIATYTTGCSLMYERIIQ
jgi:hypothetical protein